MTVDKAIIFEWYSGPVMGYLEHPVTKKIYKIDLVNEVSKEPFLREYSGYEIDESVFDDIIEFLASFQEPRFPIWFFDLPASKCDEIFLDDKIESWNNKCINDVSINFLWNLDTNSVIVNNDDLNFDQ